jgi:hypothetical protein
MTFKNFFCLVAPLLFIGVAHSQQQQPATAFQIRVVLHDPVHPTAALYVIDEKGAGVRVRLRSQEFSRPQPVLPVNGLLAIYDKAEIDLKKPEDGLVATCKLPAEAKKGVVILLPSPAGTKPPYKMLFINDSAKEFPPGESRLMNLLPMEAAVEAGGHKLGAHPGEVVRFPMAAKVNTFNMAQTNFYYKQGEAWTLFDERQLQYIEGFRRIFIVHATLGALQPTVTTIVDTTTPQ